MPSHESVGFAAYYRTSRHAGGDYYDVLDLGGDRYGIMTADVSGHGAPAAIVMAMIRAVLHTYSAPDDPSAVLLHINRHFRYLQNRGIFATALYGVLDAGRREAVPTDLRVEVRVHVDEPRRQHLAARIDFARPVGPRQIAAYRRDAAGFDGDVALPRRSTGAIDDTSVANQQRALLSHAAFPLVTS